MAEKTQPTDAEILDAADDFRSQYKHGGTTFDEFDALDFARAVLAKWGQPQAGAGEPVAVIEFTDGVKEPRIMSWNALPAGQHRVYTTPQPTQTQAGAVPLTPEQNRDEIIAMALVAGMSANIGYTEASGEHFPAVGALKTSVPVQWLERFAALVAAKEREACAQVCEGMKSVPPKGGPEDVERGFNAGLARASRAIQSRSANVA